MTDSSAHPELTRALQASVEYYGELESVLGEKQDVTSHRDLLTQGTIGIVFEHGISIIVLVEANHLASASVLLRAQFEALVRALWLHYVADDAWIEKYFAKVQADPRKDPNISRGMDDMLKDLAEKADPAIARKLVPLKDGAWGPLNSYVHTGIHPIVQQHVGYSPDFAMPTLRNSNGLTGMAALLAADLSGSRPMMMAVIGIQHAHADCLPPFNPTPAPSANNGA